MRVLKGKRKVMKEGREKPIWNDVGFTLLIGDWEGKETFTLFDDRTGEKYSMFPIDRDRRESSRPAPNDSASYGDQATAKADPVDPETVPF